MVQDQKVLMIQDHMVQNHMVLDHMPQVEAKISKKLAYLFLVYI